MNDYYFISDLHLSQDNDKLNNAFDVFIDYCLKSPPKKLYILGDLFDYYLGFDVIGAWGEKLANKIARLNSSGIKVYFLAGNRDFLIDNKFLAKSKMELIKEPSLINLADNNIMLCHGDYLCINDKLHQYYRRFSQLSIIKYLFLLLPKKYRISVAKQIRQKGRSRVVDNKIYVPVESLIVKEMKKLGANILVHGHTHQPMKKYAEFKGFKYQHIVLPDWRENAELVVYNSESKEFIFKKLDF